MRMPSSRFTAAASSARTIISLCEPAALSDTGPLLGLPARERFLNFVPWDSDAHAGALFLEQHEDA
jgi:hypothetical protein